MHENVGHQFSYFNHFRVCKNQRPSVSWRHSYLDYQTVNKSDLRRENSSSSRGNYFTPIKGIMSISQRIAKIQENSEQWKNRTPLRREEEGEESIPAKSVTQIRNALRQSQEEWRKRVQAGDAERFSMSEKLLQKGASDENRAPLDASESPPKPQIEPKRLPQAVIIRKSYSLAPEVFTPAALAKEKEQCSSRSEDTSSLVVVRKVQVPKMDENFVDSFFGVKRLDELMEEEDETEANQAVSSAPAPPSSVEYSEAPLGGGLIKRPPKPSSRPPSRAQNPIRLLREREDLLDEYEEVRRQTPPADPSNSASAVVTRMESKFTPCQRLLTSSGCGFTSTPTTHIDENAHLSETALAGLASFEDFSSKKSALRQVAEAPEAPLTSFQRILLPHKDKMLLHVKGRRHVQVRLVQPVAASVNSGDCFLLLTESDLFAWIGRFANIVEVNKIRDLAAWIAKTRDLGFRGCSMRNTPEGYVAIEEGRSTDTAVEAFWRALGVAEGARANACGPSDEDVIYENVMQHTTRVYEVLEDRLEPVPEAWGVPLRVSLLSSKKAFVFDFGSEMYLWTGNQISQNIRAAGIELLLQAYAEPYDYSYTTANPLNPMGALDCPVSGPSRPEWTLVGKLTERGETVLFREKFIDWPDGSRFPMAGKTGRKKSSEPMKETSVILEPYSAEALYTEAFKKPPPPSLLLTLEGRFVGRGGEGLLPFDGIMRRFRVDTGSVQVWLVSEYSRTLLPVISHGQFYRGETYVIRWSFHLVYTGQREVASSTRNVNNKEQCAYFFWQGSISKITQQGAAALMTVELDEEKGPQIRVVEGKEPPAFCNLFNGRMIIHDGFAPKQFTNGRLSIFEECTMSANPRMFFVRGERASEAHLLEVPPYVISLRSRGIFLIVSYSDRGIFKKSWLWIGAGAPAICRDAANYVVQRLQESCPPELGEGSFRVVELHEKTDAFGVTRDLTGEMAECLACLGSSSSLPSCVHYEDDQRLMVWQLNFTLNDQLIPSRLTYTLEPDITVAPAFGISYGAYPTNDSFYSPELPVPPFPVLISDLEAANQPALFLVLHDHTVYLWHGWWPESTLDTGDGACSSSTTPRSSNSDLATDVGAASPTFAPASPASSRSSGRLRRQQSLFVSPPVASSESRRPVSLLEDYSVNSHSPTADGNLPARGDMAGSLGSSGSGNSIAPPPPSGAGSALSRYLSARYAALKTAKALAERIGPNVLSLAVYAGIEPDSFLHLFPPTVRKEQGACYHLSTGKIYGQADCISTLIDKLDNMKFSLAELRKRPRPPDLDTTRLETYLSNEEFERAFRMTRAEFSQLPLWRKRNLKRALDLF
uniref:HP domain-containing protein n=1 Tax=Schistocephalus solidus TaxID=70667 RepID=A0A0X3PBI8_SCHSO